MKTHIVGTPIKAASSPFLEIQMLRGQVERLADFEVRRALRKGDACTVATRIKTAPGKPWRQPWYLVFAFLAALLGGCEDAPCEQQWGYFGCTFEGYSVGVPEAAPAGLQVQRNEQDVELEAIEADVAAVKECLAGVPETAPKGPHPGQEFAVVVAGDWLTSCTGEQALPIVVGSAGCVAKGQIPDEQCPCRYRAGIACATESEPARLVVTPNLKLLGDVVVRYLRDVPNPYLDTDLAACAALTAR